MVVPPKSKKAVAYTRATTIANSLDDFAAFMEDETSKNKIERLIEVPGDTMEEKAISLAIFSAFTEGVNLFQSHEITYIGPYWTICTRP